MSEKEKKVKELSAEEVLQKFDKESDKRELTGVWGKIISAICILFALFQLYTATFGVLDAHLQRAIHLAFGFLLIFLLYPSRHSWSRSKMHPFDAFLALLSAGTAMYLVVNYQELVLRAGMNTETDFIVGLIGTIMVFEAARRVVGWPMIIVAFCFMLYAFLGPYVPGFLFDPVQARSVPAGADDTRRDLAERQEDMVPAILYPIGPAEKGAPPSYRRLQQADPVAGGEPQVAFAVFDDIVHLVVNQRPAVAR